MAEDLLFYCFFFIGKDESTLKRFLHYFFA